MVSSKLPYIEVFEHLSKTCSHTIHGTFCCSKCSLAPVMFLCKCSKVTILRLNCGICVIYFSMDSRCMLLLLHMLAVHTDGWQSLHSSHSFKGVYRIMKPCLAMDGALIHSLKSVLTEL